MDFATIIGLFTGVALILWAILSSSPLSAFLHAPSAAITFGGAAAAALISFPMENLLAVTKIVRNCFLTRAKDPRELVAEMVRYAETARRDGILALERLTPDIDDPFLVSGLQMAVDGNDPASIEAVLTNELEAVEARHAEGKALFDNLGRYGPAFGMIGTLIGLVIMLGNMNDPKSIGPAMAVALITTFYGALLANLVALPLADKLALRSRQELLLKAIIIKGVMAIQSGDNPRIVEQKLKTFLPSRTRLTPTERKAA